jgi:3-oxoadipate enol-lactonase
MAFRRVNDIVLHHRVSGRSDAPTIVFSNSLGSDFRIWEAVVPSLAERYRIVLYDKRGHGLSDAPAGPYTIDDHADDLLGLLDHLGVECAAVVGLSVGGMVAQRIAVKAPARVRALVLCGTAARIGTAESWAERIAAIETSGVDAIAEAVIQRWFTPNFRTERPDDWAGWRNMLVRTPEQGYVGTCAAIRDADLTDQAGRIAVPTLCLVGDQDGSTPPELVRQTADLIPGARFETIEAAGHIPCIERPDAMARLIGQHLQEARHVRA